MTDTNPPADRADEADDAGRTAKTCTIADCAKPRKAKGLCQMHYWRLRHHGDPMYKATAEDRFWSKVDRSGECWNWTASLRNGYGFFSVDDQNGYAHRFSFELANGPIPEGMLICHRCDNRRCVRPDHLYAGTVHDNNLDTMTRNAAARKRILGMRKVRGSEHGNARLTEEMVRSVRASKGIKTDLEAARECGVSETAVNDARNYRTWKHVGEESHDEH
jgi:hypothetical protein